ncbi:MAG TPA: DUF4260 domain-containing protein [Kineosporiaceae bacterium]
MPSFTSTHLHTPVPVPTSAGAVPAVPSAKGRQPATVDPPVAGALPVVGVVTGRPLAWLRVEGVSIALTGLALYAAAHQPWWLLPVLFLAPDLSALAFLLGRRVGTWTYNLAHTTPLPLTFLGVGLATHRPFLSVVAAVGLIHIGADRFMKYGVKYDHDPAATHLGVHGHAKPSLPAGGRRPEAGEPSPRG